MRQVQMQEAEERFAELIAEAESGQSLTILRGDKPIAKVIPFTTPASATTGKEADETARQEIFRMIAHDHELSDPSINRNEIYEKRSREERMAALAELDKLMEQGYDMGLVWNGRDELYGRDK